MGLKCDQMNTTILSQLIQVTKPTEIFCPLRNKMLDSLSYIFHFSSEVVRQTAILSIAFVGRQVQQNANEEMQQYMNNEVDDILYFEDRAVFSLNAFQMLFPALIMPSIKCDLYFVYFV